MRTKNISAQVKDVDMSSREVKLYYSKFDIKDSDGDIIRKGALTKTQREWGPNGKNRIWHLDNHMPIRRVGKPKEMGEDANGAWAVTKMRDTQVGRDLMVLYDAGDITEHSFGFEVIKSENGDNATILTELKQYEYSSVTWGANMETPTINVKSEEDFKKQLKQEYDKWQKWLSKGSLSQELCQLLEIQLKQWSHALDGVKPSSDTSNEDRAAQVAHTFKKFTRKHKIKDITNGRR